MMTFGEKFKAIRKNLGWSQGRTESYLGLTTGTTSRWETGKVVPDKVMQRVVMKMLVEAEEKVRFYNPDPKASVDLNSVEALGTAIVHLTNAVEMLSMIIAQCNARNELVNEEE